MAGRRGESPGRAKLLPVYSLTEGLSQFHMRRMVWTAVEELADVPEEVFPPPYCSSTNCCRSPRRLRAIHQPIDQEALDRARRRFIFQELFVLQLAVSTRRAQQRQQLAPPLPATAKIDARIQRLLPFELTPSQTQAIGEVAPTWPSIGP